VDLTTKTGREILAPENTSTEERQGFLTAKHANWSSQPPFPNEIKGLPAELHIIRVFRG
jgi:hypothetical protein